MAEYEFRATATFTMQDLRKLEKIQRRLDRGSVTLVDANWMAVKLRYCFTINTMTRTESVDEDARALEAIAQHRFAQKHPLFANLLSRCAGRIRSADRE